MPYATVADVRNELPQVPITETSKPTSAQVQTYLDDIDRFIDASLPSMGYAAPVDSGTSPKAFALLKDLALSKAAARVLQVRSAGVAKADDPNAAAAKVLNDHFKDRWDRLLDPADPFDLPDVPDSQGTKIGDDVLSRVRLSGWLDEPTSSRDERFTRDRIF